MKEAFTYMFKDNKFAQKAAMYFCFALIASLCSEIGKYFTEIEKTKISAPILLSILIFSIVFGLIVNGYKILCTRAVLEQKENIVIPYINVKNSLFTGFKIGIAFLLIILILGPLAIISAIISPIVVKIYMSLAFLFIACFGIAFTYIFAKTDSWLSFLSLEDAYRTIKTSGWQYWKSVLVLAGLSILNAIIMILLTAITGVNIIGIIITSIIVCVIDSYLMYAGAYIIANCIKE